MNKRVFLKDFQTVKADISDAIEMPVGSTRQMTPEGYLKAVAAVTKVGVQYYSARDFGIESDEKIAVYRPPETVFHPETADSLKLKPVTFIHPVENVDAKNYNRLSVGTVGENIGPLDDTLLGAPIQITDEQTIKKIIEREINELSLGYEVIVLSEPGNYNGESYMYRMDGPMICNHLAIVPNGRCGDSVKILDQNGGNTVNKEQMIKLLRDMGISEDKIAAFMSGKDNAAEGDVKEFNALIKDAMKPNLKDLDISAIVPELIAELKPTLEEMIQADEFKTMLAQKMAEAMIGTGGPAEPGPEDQDPPAGDDPPMTQEEMDAAIQDSATKRADLIMTATPFLPDTFKVKDASERSIIEAALETAGMDKTEMASLSDDFLRGHLYTIVKDRKDAGDFISNKQVKDSTGQKLSRPATAMDMRRNRK